MTFNFRIMKRYSEDNPTHYWFEVVEVFYGEDGIPMMWGEASMPVVDHLSIEDEESNEGFDESKFVRSEIGSEWAMIANDIAKNTEMLDEYDFKPGGRYYGHSEVQEMDEVIQAIASGDEELMEKHGLKSYSSADFIKRLYKDDEDEE